MPLLIAMLAVLALIVPSVEAATYFQKKEVIIYKSLKDMTSGAEVYNLLDNYFNDDENPAAINDGSRDLHFKHNRFMSVSPSDDGLVQ
jgi:hypothetical protein